MQEGAWEELLLDLAKELISYKAQELKNAHHSHDGRANQKQI